MWRGGGRPSWQEAPDKGLEGEGGLGVSGEREKGERCMEEEDEEEERARERMRVIW